MERTLTKDRAINSITYFVLLTPLWVIKACFTQGHAYWGSRKMKVKVTQSCLTLCNPMDYTVHNFTGQNTGVGSLSLLQEIFPTQGLNSGLPLCRWFLYQPSHKGSPRILEWVAYPFSSRSAWPRMWGLLHCSWILYQLSYQGGQGGFHKICHNVTLMVLNWSSWEAAKAKRNFWPSSVCLKARHKFLCEKWVP